jgi:serine/threonine-protein kinase RsbW
VVQSHYLKVKTSLDELSVVLSWFNQIYEKQLPRTVLIQCQTILAEAFTNAVRHAHRDKHLETPIEIAVYLHDNHLKIHVWDCGPEFNLEAHIKDSCSQIDAEAVGGRGIHLIARLSDGFSYQRIQDRRNCLQMIKKY